jgi:hypothetical protein
MTVDKLDPYTELAQLLRCLDWEKDSLVRRDTVIFSMIVSMIDPALVKARNLPYLMSVVSVYYALYDLMLLREKCHSSCVDPRNMFEPSFLHQDMEIRSCQFSGSSPEYGLNYETDSRRKYPVAEDIKCYPWPHVPEQAEKTNVTFTDYFEYDVDLRIANVVRVGSSLAFFKPEHDHPFFEICIFRIPFGRYGQTSTYLPLMIRRARLGPEEAIFYRSSLWLHHMSKPGKFSSTGDPAVVILRLVLKPRKWLLHLEIKTSCICGGCIRSCPRGSKREKGDDEIHPDFPMTWMIRYVTGLRIPTLFTLAYAAVMPLIKREMRSPFLIKLIKFRSPCCVCDGCWRCIPRRMHTDFIYPCKEECSTQKRTLNSKLGGGV